MSSKEPPAPKLMRSDRLKRGELSQAHIPPSAQPQQAPALATFKANFRSDEHSYAKHKIKDIRIIKMTDFVEAKFKNMVRFEEFMWMSYVIIQYPIHEKLLQVFFSNATLVDANEHDEDPCRIGAINTFVMGMPIRVTQGVVAETL